MALYDPDFECIIETDVSDHVSVDVFSQEGTDGILHPIVYFSKKHSPAECNYEIYDKELLTVILAFQEWCMELKDSPHEIKVLSDHKNLQWFMTTKQLNQHQAQWAEYLSWFNFKIHYQSDQLSIKFDALTKRSGDLPSIGDPRVETHKQVVLKPHQITQSHLHPLHITEDSNENLPIFDETITAAYENDIFVNEVLMLLCNGSTHFKKITLSECEERKHKLWYQERLYILNNEQLQLQICEEHHNASGAGHTEHTKTLELIRWSYFWPQMRVFIEQYVRNCHTCAKSKSHWYAKFGVLKPLPIPDQHWKDISMDFVTGLPSIEGKDIILIVVDRLIKIKHFIATTAEVSAQIVADLYMNNVYWLHRFPDIIISDYNPQFVMLFWKTLCLWLGTNHLLSTAFHPEFDEQTKILNISIEQYLHTYTSYQQNDWVKWLGFAEFAVNNVTSEATQCSLFFANYRYNPHVGFKFHSAFVHSSLPTEINAHEYANHMEDVLNVLKSEMAAAQIKYADDVDRSHTPASTFKIDDLVWLNACNICTKRPSQKLDWKNLGCFAIKRVLNNYTYEFDLPDTMRIHPVFHVFKLLPVPTDLFPGQVQPPAQPIEVEGDVSWEVEEILDLKHVQGDHVQYLIKWVDTDAPTWELFINADECDDELERFHSTYPLKLKLRAPPRRGKGWGREPRWGKGWGREHRLVKAKAEGESITSRSSACWGES